jgi:hypothetical protein
MFPFIGKNFIIVFRLGPTIWRIFRVVGLLRNVAVHGSGGRRRPSAGFVGRMLRGAWEGQGCPREGLGGGGGGWGGGLPGAGGPRERRPPGEGHGRRGPARGGQGGRTPPRIQIAAEVDGMRSGYTMAYGGYGAATRPRASP